jgi:hypothetical protein
VQKVITMLTVVAFSLLLFACQKTDKVTDVEAEVDPAKERGIGNGPVDDLLPPPPVSGSLGYERPAREPAGQAITDVERTAFTKKVMSFFKDTGYWDWVYRLSHGLDDSYDPSMPGYKMWWQDTGMRREGDTIVMFHYGRAENILKRSIKVMDSAIAGYFLTGDTRMAEVATEYLKGVVALSTGMEFEREDPLVKYLHARAIFNHDHEYEVDGRKVRVDYSGAKEASFKWNVHVFEIPDNPTYGDIWVSNMRSKDDVPYLFWSLPIVTRAYYEADDPELQAAAKTYIEYTRGFSQSIVDNDWHILTKYEDGEAVMQIDATIESNPPADLGSFVHWQKIFGPDVECNAQLGAALAGYADTFGKDDCDSGMIGWQFEKTATDINYFNYNIYGYFHIGALGAAHAWNFPELAEPLMNGLVTRFDEVMYNEDLANRDHLEYETDMAGWLLAAAGQGYPLTAAEARHIMDWYGQSADHYREWEHWEPWSSLEDGEELRSYKPVRNLVNADGSRGYTYVRAVEMPYVFEYCASPYRDTEGVQFIDCEIVADPTLWVED